MAESGRIMQLVKQTAHVQKLSDFLDTWLLLSSCSPVQSDCASRSRRDSIARRGVHAGVARVDASGVREAPRPEDTTLTTSSLELAEAFGEGLVHLLSKHGELPHTALTSDFRSFLGFYPSQSMANENGERDQQ